MFPQYTTKKPAPFDKEISLTWSLKFLGAFNNLGSSEKLDWVFAIQIGKLIKQM